MQTIVLIEDILDAGETFVVEDIREFLMTRFVEFPVTARIYHGLPNSNTDVTPYDKATIDRLGVLPGPFTVVVYPEEGAEIPIIIAIIAVIIAAIAFSQIPSVPSLANQSQPSPNNDLSSRQNSARPYQRIPDIYGTVRSTPDLIALPYTVYESNIEVEYAYMCVGRGFFRVLDIRDDTTPMASISGAKVSVYDPYRSPNSTGPYSAPAGSFAAVDGTTLKVGGGAPGTLYNVRRMTSVNGQTLYAPGDSGGEVVSQHAPSSSAVGIRPSHDSNGYCVVVMDSAHYNFSAIIAALNPGDSVRISGTMYDGDRIIYDFTGSYPWDSSGVNSSTRIALASVPPGDPWIDTGSLYGSFSGITVSNAPANPIAMPTTALVPDDDTAEIWVNIVANNGAYQQNSSGVATALTINFGIYCQPCDANGNPVGTSQDTAVTLTGLASKEGVGKTYKIVLTTPGPHLVTVRRESASPSSPNVADVCQWKDLYGVVPVTQADFGDVTTVYAVTRATAGALSVKQRKLNLLVQRLQPAYLGSGTFGDLVASNSFADALVGAALDSHIGNRVAAELDLDGIYATAAAIGVYYDTDNAQEFCYTFDSNNLSFEEMVSTICFPVSCIAYRQGSLMRVSFEKLTTDSLMLFGHRNKLVGSERRSISFGPTNNFDCVQLDYMSPADDSIVSLYIPSQGINPSKITANGVRNYYQAYFLAWRAWNKLKYQNTATEFVATQEAALLKRNDRIMVADNTRPGAQDGEVVAQVGLELELSQPVVFASGKSYVIMLQGIDEQLDVIPITTGSSAYHVLMSRAPTVTFTIDANASYQSLYWIVPTDDVRPQAFLVSNREPGDTRFTQKVTAVNYDARYYANDQDLANNVIGDSSGPDGRKHIQPVPPGGVGSA